MTILFAYLSFEFYEKKWLRLKRFFSDDRPIRMGRAEESALGTEAPASGQLVV